MPNIRGLAFGAGGHGLLVTAALSVLVLAWGCSCQTVISSFCLTAMLVSYHGLMHDAAILLIPLIVLGDGRCASERNVESLADHRYSFLSDANRDLRIPNFLLAIPVIALLIASSERRSIKAMAWTTRAKSCSEAK